MSEGELFSTVPKRPKPVSSGDLRDALRLRYAMPEWAMFCEVASGTGANAGRYADAVVMNMYPSRGLAVHGFEIKISRSDWLRELKQPTKSESIQQYCDFWWVVTPKDIVQTGELPVTWGLLELRGSRLQCVTQGPKLTPKPLDRSFAAALIRRAGEVDEHERRAMLEREREEARARHAESHQRELDRGLERYRELQKQVQEFETASGIKIDRHYGGAKLGQAIKTLFDGWGTLPSRLANVESNLLQVLEQIAKARAEFPSGEG